MTWALTWVEALDGALQVALGAVVLAFVTALIAGARATWLIPKRMAAFEADLKDLRAELKDHMDGEELERGVTSGQISSVHRRIDTLILAHRGDFTRGEPADEP